MLLAAVVPLLWLGVDWSTGNRRTYWARPVTTPHRFIENDCGKCHTQPWQPAVRLVTANDAARSVADSACQHCHGEFSRDDHGLSSSDGAPRMPPDSVRDCVLCHQEHRGAERLNRVADAHCVACHGGELQTVAGKSDRFQGGIRDWESHPEFARLRDLVELTRFDETPLQFNHEKHLAAAGVKLPPSHPETKNGKQTIRLVCSDCHQPTDDGRYLKPIVYETHCGQCHPLAFSKKLAVGGPLPHSEPAQVLGVLRERLMDYARANPVVVNAARNEQQRAFIESPATSEHDRWQWVEGELLSASHGTKLLCQYCHRVQESPRDGPKPWQFSVRPPNIPNRWLKHGSFDHAAHAMVRCEDCHAVAASRFTSDINLPKIEVCRNCHGNDSRASGGGHARSDCVECHDYHDRRHGPAFSGQPMQAFLRED